MELILHKNTSMLLWQLSLLSVTEMDRRHMLIHGADCNSQSASFLQASLAFCVMIMITIVTFLVSLQSDSFAAMH